MKFKIHVLPTTEPDSIRMELTWVIISGYSMLDFPQLNQIAMDLNRGRLPENIYSHSLEQIVNLKKSYILTVS